MPGGIQNPIKVQVLKDTKNNTKVINDLKSKIGKRAKSIVKESIEQEMESAKAKQQQKGRRPGGISIIDDDSLNPEKSLKAALEKLMFQQATESDLSKKDNSKSEIPSHRNQDNRSKSKLKKKEKTSEATAVTEAMDIKGQITMKNGVALYEVSAQDMKRLKFEQRRGTGQLSINYQMVKKAPPYQAMSTDRSSLRQTRDDYFKTVEAQDLRKMRAKNPASSMDSMDDSIRNSDHVKSI